jgi:pimeloyl-ACP methyl ester carboxylesterase
MGPIEYGEDGSGAPLIMIHGAGGGFDQGLFVAQSLSQDLRVIAPSRFGYLGTPLPADVSPAAQADAHAALLDSLGVEKAIVAGVSAGAPSAIEFAIRYPDRVRALLLLVPRAYVPGREVEVPATTSNMQILRVILSGADFAYWAALRMAPGPLVRFLGVDPDLVARASAKEHGRVTAVMEMVLPLSRRVAGIRADSQAVLERLPLEKIRAPTLIITARDDLFGTLPAAEDLATHIRNAELLVLESGGHLLVERQEDVRVAVEAFLQRQGASPVPISS